MICSRGSMKLRLETLTPHERARYDMVTELSSHSDIRLGDNSHVQRE